ncbi:hypothetical protein HDA32_003893 [Spinactinospora alkalitolerans]|uniref:Copper chaperone PCu(A)C n=1 Tax=Spinactinospora alkalitolerans TaxID=687207 RepID=A0A852U1A8_9ACTN|nr:copper chaperone PCu(A)C [Spinactinospora alkalitolerans]NYE48773.1 hypothetical protein [Spinactinospora alkalitolerans]
MPGSRPAAAGRAPVVAAALLALGALAGCGSADSAEQPGSETSAATSPGPDIAVEGAAVRVPATPDVTAGYLVIDNTGGAADTLTGVRTDAAAEVQIHDTREEDGVMMMERRREVAVPAGETVELRSGGTHLMLMEPDGFEAGDTVELTLVFETSGEISVEAAVEDPMGGSTGMDGHRGHG